MPRTFLRSLQRTVSFRLTAWYAAVFAGSLLALFTVLYFALHRSLRKADRDETMARLHDLIVEYHDGGVAEVERSVRGQINPFFVRVFSPPHHTLYIYSPASMPRKIEHLLDSFTPPSPRRWTFLQLPGGEIFEITAAQIEPNIFLQVGQSTKDREEVLRRFRYISLIVILPMLVSGIAGGAFLANRVLRPIRELSRTVREIVETGKIEKRVSAPQSAGELRDLALSFNQMLARIESLLAAMRGALDNVAHDLRTPITRLRGVAELALSQPRHAPDDERSREALADCIEESERVMRMLDALMDISEVETGAMKLARQYVNASELVQEIAELYEHVAEEKKIALEIDAPPEIAIRADPARLQQALANLVDNALKYTPEGGRVRITATRENGAAILSVADSGIGIAPADQPRVWDRLYRADASRSQRGLGLGLSLVKAVVQAHGGRVELKSEVGRGSQFEIILPVEK